MPLNAKTLRNWFALTAVALLVVVLGFYFYGRYRVAHAVRDIPKKLGVDIQQSTSGFTFSKSEAGRTLFSISANKAVQYKGGQRAALTDVRIIVYGRGNGANVGTADVYDQIYGKEFDYDQSSGEVRAAGEVIIDLEAKGKPSAQATDASATPGAIHLKTSGLTFNQKTGLAQTEEKIEFLLPQASGSAMGAVYDSREMSLRLKSNVKVHTSGSAPGRPATTGGSAARVAPATISADNAIIQDEPRQAVLNHAHVTEDGNAEGRTLAADRVLIALREDNGVERVLASGDVSATTNARKPNGTSTRVQASQADFTFSDKNAVKNAVLTGGVKLDASGASPMQGSAGRVVIDFAAKNQIAKVHASENVRFQQSSPASSGKAAVSGVQSPDMQLQADAIDFFMKPGNQLERAVTSGASQIVMNSAPASAKTRAGQPLTTAGARTVVTANRFEASFAAKNRIQSLHGTGNAQIVSSSPGAPDRISTSREITAQFDPVRPGTIASVVQEGDLKYSEGQRTATANRAQLVAADDTLILAGSARIQDNASGLTLTANMARLNRRTGESSAEGDVKTTYNQLKPNPSGAMLASQGGDPVHATAALMSASHNADTARYWGGARLWQGANLVQAPVIVFDRGRRGLVASSESPATSKDSRVETVFVQVDKSGKTTPVNVTAAKLTYSDNDRRARFDGGVRVRTADTSVTSEHIDVLLRPKSARTGGQQDSASQVDQIIAEAGVGIEQQNPARKATGERLVYTAGDGKFVLTGEPGKPPSIFDAERGNVTGDSLTFYSRDDRVQVGSSESSRTVTRTRIKDESKP